ncbi:3-keto-disaccharide hydrolase [Pleomorphovibrio marinus]|uniref:3-keto-disaccharide hydrolase n=1 Tax=Pleomorphovibrio marinus TaxID=2164132 RepID=UPI000E0CA656|nr:DUF1080 domain-containing protein [Pleomorphovibrio marinus]
MKKIFLIGLMTIFAVSAFAQKKDKEGWYTLFDGKSLKGWKASENPSSFQVVDGAIKIDGPRAHLFYVGKVEKADFKNFELKTQIKTEPKANSGIFIHTEYEEDGWPGVGYEIQVNQSHGDWRKTGSVYSYKDVKETYVSDNEWYTKHIIVKDGKVTVKVNDKVINEYDEDKDRGEPVGDSKKKLSSGTIALQAHDPESIIYYKDIKIKPLP